MENKKSVIGNRQHVGLSIVRDVGCAQTLLPVFRSLVREGIALDIFCFGAASLLLKKEGVRHNCMDEFVKLENLKIKVKQLFDKNPYDFTLLGSSPSINQVLTPEQLTTHYSNEHLVPSVMVLDYWGLYKERFCNQYGDLVHSYLPTSLGVLDQRCMSDLISLGIPSEKMFISHNPWLDKIVNKTESTQHKKNSTLRNSSAIRLAFISQPLRMLRTSLDAIPQRRMFEKFMLDLPKGREFEIEVILHPAESLEYWEAIDSSMSNIKISKLGKYDRKDIFSDVDATISFDSTLVYEALHLRIPNITLGYDERFRYSYLNDLGLTQVLSNKTEIFDYFTKFDPMKSKEALIAKSAQLRSQNLFFSDGFATCRVVEVIKAICNLN